MARTDVHEVFAKFLQVFRSLLRFADAFGPVRTFLDVFGHVQMLWEAFGSVRSVPEFLDKILIFFEFVFALVRNTGEASDEMCAPTTLEISEMCSLKPFSCYCLLLLVAALAKKPKPASPVTTALIKQFNLWV